MSGLRKTAVFVVCLLAFSRVGIFAFAEETSEDVQAPWQESEFDNVVETQDEPELQYQSEQSEIQSAPIYQEEAEPDHSFGGDIVSVLLPCEIPFDIVIMQNLGQGFVKSQDFTVANKGDSDIVIAIQSIRLEIENEDFFSISEVADLPETGNNIYVELTCSNDNSSGTSILTSTPSGVEYMYHLAAGESGSFKLLGIANEFGDIPWSETNVKVCLAYRILSADMALELDAEETPAETLLDEDPNGMAEPAADQEVDESDEPQFPQETDELQETENEQSPEEQAKSETSTELQDAKEFEEADNNIQETGEPNQTDGSLTSQGESQHDTADSSSTGTSESSAAQESE